MSTIHELMKEQYAMTLQSTPPSTGHKQRKSKKRSEAATSKALSRISEHLIATSRLTPEEALHYLRTRAVGLSLEEVTRRRSQYGANEVAHEKPPTWYVQLFQAFLNPFIGILAFLAAISAVTDIILAQPDDRSYETVVILSLMITVSALLRFWQEYRSTQAAEKLKALVQTTTTVLRRGQSAQEVPLSEIVPGDMIQLAAGDMMPADMRLLASKDLFVSQSVLTGESLPVEKYDTLGGVVEKQSGIYTREITNPLELDNICFMGTNVVSGTATAVVVATGDQTYFGSMAKTLVGKRAETSFDRGISSVTWLLIRFMLVMVPIVFLVNGLTKGDWGQAFLFGISVAVGLTPEMLPMIVTANLAKGAVVMANRKVVIKRLNAIQNFGAMNILCTDKTGTLTEDKIILEVHLDAYGQQDDRVLKYAYLNSIYQTGLKNLLDVAVLEYGQVHGLQASDRTYRKVDEIPFDFVRRRMSVVLENQEHHHLLICKGAVEELLNLCTYIQKDDRLSPMTDQVKLEAKQLTNHLHADGLRVLAVAYKTSPSRPEPYSSKDEADLILVGYIGFLDPPKESAATAIAALNDSGVQVKVITGDNDIVTRKVCRAVGLTNLQMVLLGSDVEQMSDIELAEVAEQTTIFAKMTPLQKARVIKALQSRGHTVGYLGDGINDAAALRDADVGISVDTAVDVAKESADIILLEKSLTVLEEGVIEGRKTFANILKYLKMTASSNFGNMFSVLGASSLMPFLPMLPIHLLTQNLLYDISQISIPWDSVDRDFLRKPRKWDASSIAVFMLFVGPISSIFDYTTFALMWGVFGANTVESAPLFQSGWFIEGLLSQTLIVHMIRTARVPFLQSTASLPVLLLTGAVMAIGIYIPFSPFGRAIGMVPLPGSYFPWLLITLLSYCLLTQFIKGLYIHRFKSWL
jgi:Mg2+-importing ATPase